MTPAINTLKKAKVPHQIQEYEHNPNAESYGEEAAQALGLNPEQVFKTLLVSLAGHKSPLAVAVVPVSGKLSLKAVAKALGAKKADMADSAMAEKITGYLVGGISPLGQKKSLPTLIDASAQKLEKINVSAGRRGLEVSLSPDDLARLTRASFAAIAAQ